MQGRIQDFKLGGILKKIFEVFRVKNHDFMPKNHIFSNFRACAPPSLDLPLSGHINTKRKKTLSKIMTFNDFWADNFRQNHDFIY
jgi:hypothetical protein